ncbi:MAG TPA: DNA methyltransferase [Alphaproteobacteria bacterium]|nr:DNA methyltransferase [Alphaproteobacteria bacterium]
MTSAYPVITSSPSAVKEQLLLFALEERTPQGPHAQAHFEQDLPKRERLAILLSGELNFHGEDSGYASHDLHAFAAKFPPQLPRAFIRSLTRYGDLVLDPMMGSGTTVVEALLEGRRGIGLDIDPLALRLSTVKTTRLELDNLRSAGDKVLLRANALLSDGRVVEKELRRRFDERTQAFINYWFLPTTQRELMALVLAIEDVADRSVRHFLELAFSSIIVTKSGGVSLARDLAHSRPHLDKTKVPKNALEQYALRLRKNFVSIAQLKTNGMPSAILAGDARDMPVTAEIVDLIVTSPPYANAIDYMRAHKFSLVWLGGSVGTLSKLRAGYIGSERTGHISSIPLPDMPQMVIQQLAERDRTRAVILRKYFIDMKSVFAEFHRVLRSNGAAIVVVGTSMMRGIDIQTHYCLADIAAATGFDVVGVVKRILDRNKRMMPASFGKKTNSMIEQRMHEEYVIGLLKR